MDRLFLDANILYAAAYKRESALRRFWEIQDVELVSSAYAVEEARRNLREDRPAKVPDLEELVARLRIHPGPPNAQAFPKALALVIKDRPILWAAIETHATHLITCDRRHFGPYFGRRIGGVLILLASDYPCSRPPCP